MTAPRALEPALFRAVMGRFATGVTVVTSVTPEGPVGMTANAVCSVSLRPLLLLVCFDNGSRTLAAVQGGGRFGVNVLAADQEPLAVAFAAKGPETAKFAQVAHERIDGVPVLDAALAWVTCDLQRTVPAGDHTIGIGAVRAAGHRDGAPLLWYRGRYESLPEPWPDGLTVPPP